MCTTGTNHSNQGSDNIAHDHDLSLESRIVSLTNYVVNDTVGLLIQYRKQQEAPSIRVDDTIDEINYPIHPLQIPLEYVSVNHVK